MIMHSAQINQLITNGLSTSFLQKERKISCVAKEHVSKESDFFRPEGVKNQKAYYFRRFWQ